MLGEVPVTERRQVGESVAAVFQYPSNPSAVHTIDISSVGSAATLNPVLLQNGNPLNNTNYMRSCIITITFFGASDNRAYRLAFGRESNTVSGIYLEDTSDGGQHRYVTLPTYISNGLQLIIQVFWYPGKSLNGVLQMGTKLAYDETEGPPPSTVHSFNIERGDEFMMASQNYFETGATYTPIQMYNQATIDSWPDKPVITFTLGTMDNGVQASDYTKRFSSSIASACRIPQSLTNPERAAKGQNPYRPNKAVLTQVGFNDYAVYNKNNMAPSPINNVWLLNDTVFGLDIVREEKIDWNFRGQPMMQPNAFTITLRDATLAGGPPGGFTLRTIDQTQLTRQGNDWTGANLGDTNLKHHQSNIEYIGYEANGDSIEVQGQRLLFGSCAEDPDTYFLPLSLQLIFPSTSVDDEGTVKSASCNIGGFQHKFTTSVGGKRDFPVLRGGRDESTETDFVPRTLVVCQMPLSYDHDFNFMISGYYQKVDVANNNFNHKAKRVYNANVAKSTPSATSSNPPIYDNYQDELFPFFSMARVVISPSFQGKGLVEALSSRDFHTALDASVTLCAAQAPNVTGVSGGIFWNVVEYSSDTVINLIDDYVSGGLFDLQLGYLTGAGATMLEYIGPALVQAGIELLRNPNRQGGLLPGPRARSLPVSTYGARFRFLPDFFVVRLLKMISTKMFYGRDVGFEIN